MTIMAFVLFILGFATCQYFIPILDSLCGMFLGVFEIAKAKISLKITKINNEIEKISDDKKEKHHPIGFQVPEEGVIELCYDDEEEDE